MKLSPIIVLPLLLGVALCQAQVSLNNMELGLCAGGMNYMGDLKNQSLLGKPSPAWGAFYRQKFGDRWALSLSAAYGHVEGGNPDVIEKRNLSFRSYIAEAAIRMEFNFFPLGKGDMHFRWSPYVFGGLGAFAFNPQARYTDPAVGSPLWYDLRPLGTEGQGTPDYPEREMYETFQIALPFGVGIKWHISRTVTLAAEYGFRKTWTDYLDDVSTTYADPDIIERYRGTVAAALADRSGEVEAGFRNATGIKRGDDSLNDWYAFFNLSLSVSFDTLFGWMRKKKCN